MYRELLLLRHAKADVGSGTPDLDRPLVKRGKQDATKIGARLYREGLIPDQVISSPAKRARQTAVRVCKSLEIKKKKIILDTRIYDAAIPTLLAVLAERPLEASTVLIIGHNPSLEQLLLYLAGDEVKTPSDGKLLPPASVARLELPVDWSNLPPGSGQLISITRSGGRKG